MDGETAAMKQPMDSTKEERHKRHCDEAEAKTDRIRFIIIRDGCLTRWEQNHA